MVGAIRSAYEAQTHFYHDSADLAGVLWYFVPEDTPNLPFPSMFCDTVWNERNAEVQQPIGEIQTGHIYSKGFPPAAYPTNAKLPCGTREQWLNGASINDPFPGVYSGTTVPTCCPDFLQLANPGGASEGRPPPLAPACAGTCDRPPRVYCTVLSCTFFSVCDFSGIVIPMDVKSGPILIGTNTWEWMYESLVFTVAGVQRRVGLLCFGVGNAAMFSYNDGASPHALGDVHAALISCSPFHYTSAIIYGFPDVCSVSSCDVDIHE